MFSTRTFNKLPSTAREIQRNKTCLDTFADIDVFAKNKSGAWVYPGFADFAKVIHSLRVVDKANKKLPRQTEDLQIDIIKTSRQDAYLELVYNVELPTRELYLETFREKLMINLANLVLEPEISKYKALSAEEIARIKEAFDQMLENA